MPCIGFQALELQDAELSHIQMRMLAAPRQHTERLRLEARIGELEIVVLKEDWQIGQHMSIQQSRVEESQSSHVWPNCTLDGLSCIQKCQHAIANSKLQ